MAVPAEEVLTPEAPDQGVSAFLAGEFAAHRHQMECAWTDVMRARGWLRELAPKPAEDVATCLLQTWCDFFVPERTDAALAQVRARTVHAVQTGMSSVEALHPALVLREISRQYLLDRFHGDPERIAEIIPAFERLAQRVTVFVAECFAEEMERRVRQRMQALIEAGMLLTAEQGLDRVLQKIVNLAREIVGARYAALAVLNGDGQIGQLVTAGVDEATHARLTALPTGSGILGVVLREPVRVADVSRDPRAVGFPPEHPPMCAFLGVPISSRGRVYGNLYLTDKPEGDAFTAEDELLVTTFASQAAAAIENAHSLENVQLLEASRHRERLHAELLQRVIAAQEEERKRVARELHDNTGQALTSLIIGLRTLESAQSLAEVQAALRDMRRHAGQALDELHHLAFELRPSVLDDLGLAVALQRYVKDFSKRTGIHMEAQLESLKGVSLAPAVDIALYRIVQEALTNVAKHAQATTVSVLLQPRGDSLLLIVEDNGRGFEVPDVTDSRGKHFGLMGMHERVGLLGGKLTIESTPGVGTTVFIEVPAQMTP